MLWCRSNAAEANFLERKWHVLVRPAVPLQEKWSRSGGWEMSVDRVTTDQMETMFRLSAEPGLMAMCD